ncbi:MAG: hypothetical protein ACD_62C00170G0011 [uncultured bacterium]|nr:MAG: hypothetical protein ACD_62C00170G0011 [uncultured bacterium]HLD44523.1 bifunctional oligoribonuclease/PAP phosphatase NrnA [bacterium]
MTSKTKKISQKKIISSLLGASQILVTTHENIDGDGLGAMIALGQGLVQLGKKTCLYSKDGVPRIYQFLPGQKSVCQKLDLHKKFDLTLVLDVAERKRVSDVFLAHRFLGTVISIDHHVTGSPDTDYIFSRPQQASCGELIYSLLAKLPVQITKEMATNLYTAIATDTGSFKYSNTKPQTLTTAARLLALGVDVWQVSQNCFEMYSLPRMALLKRLMPKIEVHPCGKIAWVVLTQHDFKVTCAKSEDAEGFINYPRFIEGVEVAVLFKQKSSRVYKVSMRSKEFVDVAAIAAKFGGGGHVRASGCTIEGSLTEIKKQILTEILFSLRK